MITPQYVGGLVSWGAIGARTTESQVHRQLVSVLSCPVGFKNATSGDAQIAVEAILSAAQPHTFLGTTKQGQSAIFVTTGNPDCHLILRGGRNIVNYTAEAVAQVCNQLKEAGLAPRVMIDCSHANSNKDYKRQAIVCRDAAQIAAETAASLAYDRKQLGGGEQKLVLAIRWCTAEHHRWMMAGRNTWIAWRVCGGGPPCAVTGRPWRAESPYAASRFAL
jgi:3-deoxy-7-phosphoheptulonate synthase